MRDKKGFTLVELLAVIIILALIVSITLYAFTSIIGKSKNTTNKIEAKELIDASMAYYNEYKNTDNYKYHTVSDVKYSCISVQSLIDKGYYKSNVEFSNDNINTSTVVKIMEQKNGVTDYDITTSSDSECGYANYSASMDNYSFTKKSNDGLVVFSGNIKNNNNGTYDFSLKIDANKIFKTETITNPVYVLIILDRSSSVLTTKYNRAVDIIKNMSNNLINNHKLENSKIGLISYVRDNTAVNREFAHSYLNSEIPPRDNGGDYSNNNMKNIFSLAIDKFNSIPEKNAMKYLILISDGKGGGNGGSVANNKNRVDGIGAKLITVNLASSSRLVSEVGAEFKKFSSVDDIFCNKSDYVNNGLHVCYYLPDNTAIENLFNELTTNSTNNNIQFYKSANIKINFPSYIKIYDNLGNNIKNINYNANFSTNNKLITTKYTIKIDQNTLNDMVLPKTKANLFNDFNINLINKDNVSQIIKVTDNVNLNVNKGDIIGYIN